MSKKALTEGGSTLPTWLPLRKAADILGKSPDALRRQFERLVRRGADGERGEVCLNGVRDRKFGRTWLVRFSPDWLA